MHLIELLLPDRALRLRLTPPGARVGDTDTDFDYLMLRKDKELARDLQEMERDFQRRVYDETLRRNHREFTLLRQAHEEFVRIEERRIDARQKDNRTGT